MWDFPDFKEQWPAKKTLDRWNGVGKLTLFIEATKPELIIETKLLSLAKSINDQRRLRFEILGKSAAKVDANIVEMSSNFFGFYKTWILATDLGKLRKLQAAFPGSGSRWMNEGIKREGETDARIDLEGEMVPLDELPIPGETEAQNAHIWAAGGDPEKGKQPIPLREVNISLAMKLVWVNRSCQTHRV